MRDRYHAELTHEARTDKPSMFPPASCTKGKVNFAGQGVRGKEGEGAREQMGEGEEGGEREEEEREREGERRPSRSGSLATLPATSA